MSVWQLADKSSPPHKSLGATVELFRSKSVLPWFILVNVLYATGYDRFIYLFKWFDGNKFYTYMESAVTEIWSGKKAEN